METRRIGSLEVSVVGLGTNQLGTTCDASETAAIVHAALESGITFIDTADEYGDGLAEEYLGRALRGRRDDVIVATKAGYPLEGRSDSGGASAQWLTQAAEESLRRLGTDRIDLFQQHRPDPSTPLEETLAAMDALVTSGKVREVGCCNFTGAMLHEATTSAAAHGWSPYRSSQNCLNLLQRAALDDVVPVVHELDMAFIPYWPLASGVLTDKYRQGQPPPAGTRLAEQVTDEARARLLSDRTFARLDALRDFAAARGRTVLDLAYAWLLAVPRTATVISGATRPEQVSSNVAASGWRLSIDEADAVTDLVAGVARPS